MRSHRKDLRSDCPIWCLLSYPNTNLTCLLLILLISPERIELETCACAQIEALREGKRWLYLDDAGDPSERGRSAANLTSDGGDLFCCSFSNWCHGSADISWTNRARKLCLRSNWSSWRGEYVVYFDDAWLLLERRRTAINLISDGGGHLCPFSSNWCHGSANISWTNQPWKLSLRSN